MLLPSVSLADLAEKYHLVPFVLLFFLVGVAGTFSMAIRTCLRCLSEVVDAFYEFKVQCAESRRRYASRK